MCPFVLSIPLKSVFPEGVDTSALCKNVRWKQDIEVCLINCCVEGGPQPQHLLRQQVLGVLETLV